MSLIERLEAANKGLVGAREHHAAIEETVDLLRRITPLMEKAKKFLEATDDGQESLRRVQG